MRGETHMEAMNVQLPKGTASWGGAVSAAQNEKVFCEYLYFDPVAF